MPRERRRSQIMPHHRRLLHDRGISDEVIDGAVGVCRYASYRRGDDESLLRWAPQYQGQRWLKSIVKSSHGLIIIRRELVAATWDRDLRMAVFHQHLTPQIRPDRPPFEEAKYLFPRDFAAKEIDIHPMAKRMMKAGNRPHYFCLEGSLNADAVVSRKMPAYSVPGVGMWDADNLHDYIPHMRKAPAVYVVSDNDWRQNTHVARQVRNCVEALGEKGVTAMPVAPPAGFEKDGVGDLLGRPGGSLDQLEEVNLKTPEVDLIEELIMEELPSGRRPRARQLVARLLMVGLPCFNPSRVKGMAHGTKYRALGDLVEAGIVEETKPDHNVWDGTKWVGRPATFAWPRGLQAEARAGLTAQSTT